MGILAQQYRDAVTEAGGAREGMSEARRAFYLGAAKRFGGRTLFRHSRAVYRGLGKVAAEIESARHPDVGVLAEPSE